MFNQKNIVYLILGTIFLLGFFVYSFDLGFTSSISRMVAGTLLSQSSAPTGDIYVHSNVSTSWTITGPSGPYSSTGTDQIYSMATPGTYTISANPVPGYNVPTINFKQQALANGGWIYFELNYTPRPTLANMKLLVLLTKFQNTVTEPYSVADLQGQVFTNPNSVKQFYEKVSYNRMSVTGDVFGWYTIPDATNGVCNIKKWMDDGELVAQQNGVNVGQYTNIIYVFPSGDFTNSGCLYGGQGYPLDVPPRGYVWNTWVGLISHELGHTLGLNHSEGLDCGQDSIKVNYHSTCTFSPYSDPFDFMGLGESAGQNLFSFNAPKRISQGWLLPSNIQSVTADGTFVINALETSSAGVQVLKIKKPDYEAAYTQSQYDYYYIDYNPDIDYDLGKRVDGVTIRIWNNLIDYTSLMLDMTPESCLPSPLPGGCMLRSDWNDGMLKDGMTFVDNNGIRITQVSHTNTQATIRVVFPPTTSGTTTTPTSTTTSAPAPTPTQTTPSSTLTTTKIFESNLKYGMQNSPDVSSLQLILTNKGFYSGAITGNFFNLTLQAVKNFQTQRGITPTGFVGPLTRAELSK